MLRRSCTLLDMIVFLISEGICNLLVWAGGVGEAAERSR